MASRTPCSNRAVRCWHEKTWSKIRAKAKKDGGEILFADQVTGRTWGEKGKTPVLRRSRNRFSVHARSAISTKGRMDFMVFAESLTAEVTCRFLDQLAGHFDHEIHLVVDGHSAPARRRSATGSPPIRRRRAALPPRLLARAEPDELLNADFKRSLPKQHQARDQAELVADTRRFFRRRQR
ncbi:transposase [Streptomyces sp. NBC_01754]|uniref:transposase n=1 Tax=Streptomyces sp. NBC_01754 TaxID=2975930 RepID=UPI002DD9C81B|nr:transposase [Streptomyces sp. NBC_01754]